MLPFIAQPIWLLLPLVVIALFLLQPARGRLAGGWTQLIGETLQRYLSRGVSVPKRDWRRLLLVSLWCLLAVMLARFSFGFYKPPDLANLYARVLVLDLGTGSDESQLLAARQIIQQYPEVPTAIVAVVEQAFDVVPVTTDQRHLDRYLEVLSGNLMPVGGRRPERGLQRAALLLRRGDILAGQIILISAGTAPASANSVAALASRYGIWIITDGNESSWQAYSRIVGTDVNQLVTAGVRGMPAIAADLENRRAAAAASAASIRERRDLTPWLIVLSLPLWMLLFFRRNTAL